MPKRRKYAKGDYGWLNWHIDRGRIEMGLWRNQPTPTRKALRKISWRRVF